MPVVLSRTVPLRWHRLIDELLKNPNRGIAAAAAGVPVKTVERWMSVPGFQKEFCRRAGEAFEVAAGMARGAAQEAVRRLFKEMASAKPNQLRIKAAEVLLQQAFRAAELIDFQARLEKLENARAGLDGQSLGADGRPAWESRLLAKQNEALGMVSAADSTPAGAPAKPGEASQAAPAADNPQS